MEEIGGPSSVKINENTYTARGGGGGKKTPSRGVPGQNGVSYSGGGKGGLGGAYPAQDYRYPETGGNGWIYIEYGGDI